MFQNFNWSQIFLRNMRRLPFFITTCSRDKRRRYFNLKGETGLVAVPYDRAWVSV